MEAAFDLFDSDSENELTEIKNIKVVPSYRKVEISRPVGRKVELWKDHPPLYYGSIKVENEMMDIGGSRGYITTESVKTGTLLLEEEAFVSWPERETSELFVDTIKRIDLNDDVCKALGKLYPEHLKDLPMHVLETGKKRYETLLRELNSERSMDELLQLIFAMQCNAFASGVFLHCAILNHSCSPNCIKFTPSDNPNVSQVRALRDIEKGEALTISYLLPVEQRLATRQRLLNEQFGFKCCCEFCGTGDNTADTFTGIEEHFSAVEEFIRKKEGSRGLALILELFSDALEVASHDDMVFIRIHKLVSGCCELLLLDTKCEQYLDHAILFLRSNVELLELQSKYLAPQHFDLCTTLQDISRGMQLLLACDADKLYNEFPVWNKFAIASHAESQFRSEYQAIMALYK